MSNRLTLSELCSAAGATSWQELTGKYVEVAYMSGGSRKGMIAQAEPIERYRRLPEGQGKIIVRFQGFMPIGVFDLSSGEQTDDMNGYALSAIPSKSPSEEG